MFWGCSGLRSITFNGTKAEWNAIEKRNNWKYRSSVGTIHCTDGVIDVSEPAYTVNEDGKTCTITGIGTCTDGDRIIPETIGGYKVTAIGERAFSGCSGLTSIVIPDGVTSIGEGPFEYCLNLTKITVSSDNKNYQSIDGNLYSKDGKTLIQYACGKTDTSFTIPNSVTSIGGRAFAGCSSLTSIEIPDSVTSIGDWAFSNCVSLTSIEIPNNVTSIGNCVFAACSSLTSIEIPDGVTSIGGAAFNGCSSLTSIDIPDSVTSIGSAAFAFCSGLTSIEMPDSVTSIGSGAFEYCSSLMNVEIPNSVTSIEDWVFRGCSSLTSITFNGTKEQWNVIEKGYSWNNNTSLTTIRCTDGDIAL